MPVMRYTVKHVTRFNYDTPVSESIMEARMQPRSDGAQRCLQFNLTTTPAARVMLYQDHDGNIVHHFNVPGRHSRLTVTAEAIVETAPMQPPPDALEPSAWQELDRIAETGECFEFLAPSVFSHRTERLAALEAELALSRESDPLTVLRRLMHDIYEGFEYNTEATDVDSPIDVALEARSGVCQDFAHIFIAIARRMGIPARYVSGYLLMAGHRDATRAPEASHAWTECYLPGLGWLGFDPTHDVIVDETYVRVAVGRDYADVPPTRGVYKGTSDVKSELAVAVRVSPVGGLLAGDAPAFTPWLSREAGVRMADLGADAQGQQQQQQQ